MIKITGNSIQTSKSSKLSYKIVVCLLEQHIQVFSDPTLLLARQYHLSAVSRVKVQCFVAVAAVLQ